MEYNKRKMRLLNHLADGWNTAKRIYDLSEDKSEIGISSTRMALLRYHRQGLLYRKKTGHHREYEYTISKRGKERLEWLEETESQRNKSQSVEASGDSQRCE